MNRAALISANTDNARSKRVEDLSYNIQVQRVGAVVTLSVLGLALGCFACGPASSRSDAKDAGAPTGDGSVSSAAGARCTNPILLDDGDFRKELRIARDTENSPVCAGGLAKPARHYRATIPSGQQLRVRVVNDSGISVAEPVLQLFSSCAQLSCLATGRPDDFGGHELRYVNQSPEAEEVQFAVAAAAPYVLSVRVAEPLTNVTCQAARPIGPGVISNQSLAEARSSPGRLDCGFRGRRSLFYRAEIAVSERLTVTVVPRREAMPGQAAPSIGLRDGCEGCIALDDTRVATFTNDGKDPRTLTFEVNGPVSDAFDAFDLKVESQWLSEAVVVKAAPNLKTSEAGGAVTFTVALAGPPRSPVIVAVASSDAREGVASPPSLQFDHRTWAQPQTVTVTGVDDDRSDGHRAYHIALGPAQSADPRFSGLAVKDVALVNRDDEPGIDIEVATPIVTSEAGLAATLPVSLSHAPIAVVSVGFKSSDAKEAAVSPDVLVFDPSNWNTPQVIAVTGVDDAIRDGRRPYEILIEPVTSLDAQYSRIDPQSVAGENWDDDWDAIEPTRINGSRRCFGDPGRNAIAADAAGGLYVATTCVANPADNAPTDYQGLNRVLAAGSTDGGRTFSGLVSIAVPVGELHLVGTSPGHALLAVDASTGLFVSRSDDGGRSWTEPERIVPVVSSLHVAAHGARVAMVGGVGVSQTLVWVSKDGGKTFLPPHAIDGVLGVSAVGIDADGVIWIAAGAGERLRKSSDDGATFDEGMPLSPLDFAISAQAFGPRTWNALSQSKGLVSVDKNDVASQRFVPGSPGARSQFLVVDRADNLTVIRYAPGNMLASRIPFGADAVVSARSYGDFGPYPVGAALSARAVALMMDMSNGIFVAVATWP